MRAWPIISTRTRRFLTRPRRFFAPTDGTESFDAALAREAEVASARNTIKELSQQLREPTVPQ